MRSETSEPFTFGIALMPRASAGNWSLVQALLNLTLRSALAQTHRNFRVVIAGHDRPDIPFHDPRITFLKADWPVQPPGSDNADGGRKKYMINQFVLAHGGGYLMYLDADDWVDTRLVETTRALVPPRFVGGILDEGVAVDVRRLRVAPLPHEEVFDYPFHRICGSSTVAHIDPDSDHPIRRDPYAVFHEHHRWPEVAEECGLELVRLPLVGSYLVNTSENHSETHGPFADWRRDFNEGVNRIGEELDEPVSARFGLRVSDIRAVSDRFLGRPSYRHPGMARTLVRGSSTW